MKNLSKLEIPKNINNLLQNADVIDGIMVFNRESQPLPTTTPIVTTVQNISQEELAVINQAADRATAFTKENPGGIAPKLTIAAPKPNQNNYTWLLPVLMFGGFVVASKIKNRKK